MVRKDDSYESADQSSSDTEEYLDIADLNDFMDCNSPPIWHTEKLKTIATILDTAPDPDSEKTLIRKLCYSRGGLLNGNLLFIYSFVNGNQSLVLLDNIRKKLWPSLVDYESLSSFEISSEDIRSHTYYNQVVLDVNRILQRFPPGEKMLSKSRFE